MDTADVICALLCCMMSRLCARGKSLKLLGRAFDLSAAYRQLCVSEASQDCAWVGVYNPVQGRAQAFMQVALPFGARAAVNGFIRSARFLQWLALKCLTILNSCYFDDFATFSVPLLASNTDECMSMLLDLLGWAFDREGPKADQFGPSLSVLGVEIDLERSDEGTIFVANTAKRRDELVHRLDDVLLAGTLSRQAALELRGRLAFAESQIMGLAGQRGLKEVLG